MEIVAFPVVVSIAACEGDGVIPAASSVLSTKTAFFCTKRARCYTRHTMSEETKKSIVAKMNCDAVVEHGDYEEVHLSAVYSPDPAHENYQWSKWTPAGQVRLCISNPEARGTFVQGKEYFVTFAPAPEEAAEQPKQG